MCNECQFWKPYLHLEVLELTSHTVTALWAVRWLTAQQFIIRYRMPEQTVHIPHPLYNPEAQGNWHHSLDTDIDGSEFYKCHYERKIFLASNYTR